jgi:CheY-like chemotaxis protein
MDYVKQLKVLLVEPSGFTAKLVRETLEGNLGVPLVLHASSGADGAGVLTETRLNLLVVKVDADCPDGMSLIERIRAGLGDVPEDLPIIAMTAAPTRQLVEQLRDHGVNEILALPLTAKALAGRIQSVFEHPRDWIVSATFVGPDRRRKKGAGFQGGERRDGQEATPPAAEAQPAAKASPPR